MVGIRKVCDPVRLSPGWAFGLLVLLLGALPFGCGGQSVGDPPQEGCYELCEQGKKARCPTSETWKCEDQCFSEDYRANGTGCSGEYAKVIDCTRALENVCTALQACDDEYEELFDCYRDACKNSNALWCTGVQ